MPSSQANRKKFLERYVHTDPAADAQRAVDKFVELGTRMATERELAVIREIAGGSISPAGVVDPEEKERAPFTRLRMDRVEELQRCDYED
jgi:hypothetical protein